jgi:8-oxo-dGTP pyrophosphatase MutT (NUDIX family)
MKYAVQAVILNDKGEVLAVSRKDDHNDFGLCGGKVDEDDYNHHPIEPKLYAIEREVKEETGLTVNMDSATLIFQTHKGGYMGITYLIPHWSGEIHTEEPHVVKWVSFETVMRGSFGKWNRMVHESLVSMGIPHKLSDEPEDTYYFEIDNLDDGNPYVWIVSKLYWDKNQCISDRISDDEYEDIRRISKNANIQFAEASESCYDLTHNEFGHITDKTQMEEIMIGAGFIKKIGIS